MSKIKELQGKYDAGLAEAKSHFDRMKDTSLSSDQVKTAHEAFDAKEKELKSLWNQIDSEVKMNNLNDLETARKTATNLPGQGREENDGSAAKSLGELFLGSDEFKAVEDFHNIGKNGLVVSTKSWKHPGLKTAGSDITLGNVPAFGQQVPGIVGSPIFPTTLMDFLPKFNMQSNSYEYFRENAVQNNAATQATELSPLVKSGFTTTKITVNAAPVGTYFRVAETQLRDQSNLRSFMDARIVLFVNIEAERQLFVGTGTNEMTGLYNISGRSTYAKGTTTDNNGDAETSLDAIYSGIVKVRVDGVANPSVIAIHPDNMKPITLLKDANGNYIYKDRGSMWGVPLLETPRATSGSAIVADLSAFGRLGICDGMQIVLERNSTDLIDLAFTLRAYARMAFEMTRALAVCEVTALS